MDVRQLEYLVAVVEEGSFTRAAERVHVAQPGVSAQLRRLERELGATLLDRSGRTIHPTDVGESVLAYARSVLDAMAGIRQVADEHAGVLRGRVAVGMVTACGAADVPELLAGFHQRYPEIEISLTEDDSDPLIQQVYAGRLDVALCGLGATAPSGLATRVLADEALVAAVAHGHPLAQAPWVDLTRLEQEPLICLPDGTGIRSILDEACRRGGLRPQVAFEASNLAIQANLAARGLGVAVVPSSTGQEYAAELSAVPIEPRLRGGIGWVWRAEDAVRHPARQALIAHVEKSIVG